jgi:hypothetical protein
MDLEDRRQIGIDLGSGGASLSFLEKQYRYYFANEAKTGEHLLDSDCDARVAGE